MAKVTVNIGCACGGKALAMMSRPRPDYVVKGVTTCEKCLSQIAFNLTADKDGKCDIKREIVAATVELVKSINPPVKKSGADRMGGK